MLKNALDRFQKRFSLEGDKAEDTSAKKWFGAALFFLSTALFLWLFAIFLKPFVAAALLVLATAGFCDKVEARLQKTNISIAIKNKEPIAAFILTCIFVIFVFAPIGYAIIYIVSEAPDLSGADIGLVREKLEAFTLKTEFLSEESKARVVAAIGSLFDEKFWLSQAKPIAGSIGGFFGQIASSLAELALVAVFFFLLHWFKKDISEFIKSLIPLEKEQKEATSAEITGAITVVFYTFLGVMAAQGAAFFALMLFFDYDAPILGFFAALSSVVPVFGTGLVWIPIALLEFFKGNALNAVLIALYSWVVMAVLIDNFLRLYLLNAATKSVKSAYKINEFLMFFSIAAGIAAFGFWGVIIGPSITALFLSSARIIRK